MPAGFNTYNGKVVATRYFFDEDKTPELSSAEREYLLFSDRVFEACESGLGLVCMARSSRAEDSQVQARIARIVWEGDDQTIGIVAPDTHIVLSVSSMFDAPLSTGLDQKSLEAVYTEALSHYLGHASRPSALPYELAAFNGTWDVLTRIAGKTHNTDLPNADFAKRVMETAWTRVRTNTTSLKITLSPDRTSAVLDHGFGSCLVHSDDG